MLRVALIWSLCSFHLVACVSLVKKHEHRSFTINTLPPQTYQYPKTDDQLVCLMAHSHHNLDHLDSEVLSSVDPEVELWFRTQAYMQETARNSYLDIGCGMGRIVSKFGGLFGTSTCLEPDSDRIEEAKANVGHERFPGHVDFVNKGFLDFEAEPESFDVVTLMQVVQHLPLEAPGTWLRQIYRLLRPNGALIMATTFYKDFTFFLARMPTGDPIQLSPAQFNFIASHTKVNGSLPVHTYTAEELATLALNAGFRVLEQKPFTYWKSTPYSQYIVLVKPGSTVPAEPPSPSLDSIHVSEMEQKSLNRLRRVLMGVDTSCGNITESM